MAEQNPFERCVCGCRAAVHWNDGTGLRACGQCDCDAYLSETAAASVQTTTYGAWAAGKPAAVCGCGHLNADHVRDKNEVPRCVECGCVTFVPFATAVAIAHEEAVTRVTPREPVLHTHITDGLADDHPLVHEEVNCESCREMLHAAYNECMQTWVETGLGAFCLTCFADVYESTRDLRTLALPEPGTPAREHPIAWGHRRAMRLNAQAKTTTEA